MTHYKGLPRGSSLSAFDVNASVFRFTVLAILIAAVGLISSKSYAGSLNLTPGYPNFTLASDQVVDFDVGTLTLSVSGSLGSYTEVGPGGVLENEGVIYTDTFSLTATFDNSGSLQSGSFSISGGILTGNAPPNHIAYADQLLLAGDLNLFGASNSVAPVGQGLFEFKFDNASGIIATGPWYEHTGTASDAGGIQLYVDNSGLADFENDFYGSDWTGDGYGQAWVPVPAAVWLFGSGLAGLAGFSARRRKNIQRQ